MKVNVVGSEWLVEDGIRLGAQFYANEGQTALRYLHDAGVATDSLIDLCTDIFIPPRFKRPYVADTEYGFPFVSSSDVRLACPQDEFAYLSKELTPKQDRLRIAKGMILVSCSGTVGNVVLVNDNLDGVLATQHLMRVVPDTTKVPLGYICVYLSSPAGKSLLQKPIYGSVVDHIEAHHVYSLPVPRIGSQVEQVIHEKAVLASDHRADANRLLDKAHGLLYELLALVPLRSAMRDSQERLITFHLPSTVLDLRLDASYYNPLGREAIHSLETRDDCRLLGDKDLTLNIFHPFRMNMVLVDDEHGVPFLGGGDIVEYRYFGDKYISQVTEGYGDYLLGRGWTLMTIGGTVGRVAYVGDYLNGWAASQHVTRIVPNEKTLLPGYLNAYMGCEYAHQQVKNLIYGSVIDTVRESQLEALRIPVPPKNVQQPIHDLVEEAYRLRYEANQLEDEAQGILMQALGLAENQ